MSAKERVTELKSRFNSVSGFEDRYKMLIEMGKSLSPYPEPQRLEKFKVKGCQSQVWLYPEFKDGRVHLFGDSDALIVKGVLGVIVFVYDQLTPQEILDFKADFVIELGLKDQLSMNRSNGMMAILKQIQMYAFVFNQMK